MINTAFVICCWYFSTMSAELFWNKCTVSKCFLLACPWVTLQPGILSQSTSVFFSETEKRNGLSVFLLLNYSHQSPWYKNKYICFSELLFRFRRKQSCFAFFLLTSRCWNNLKSRRCCKERLNTSVILLAWAFYSGNPVSWEVWG